MIVGGSRLRQLREDHGLTLTELARQAMVSKGYLSMIENGTRRDVSPPVVARLAAALDVAIKELRA